VAVIFGLHQGGPPAGPVSATLWCAVALASLGAVTSVLRRQPGA
jgi:DHA2 family multidrug resistance protein-like MFS transporter